MADPRLTRDWRLTAFDLPWHGKSPPPPGSQPGDWRLTTDRYVEIIMGVIRAAGLHRPVVLGASMSGEICLELALRHPEAFGGIIACEASAHIEGRKTGWAEHPQVDQMVFTPEWIEGLVAPKARPPAPPTSGGTTARAATPPSPATSISTAANGTPATASTASTHAAARCSC
ncbi:alpha/beta fold hydrolase [Paeniroseomonas aquatica]|uniref:alpha/beta fold hydrolase n=1 Tax=Paeniroseomonas aquatica TaxID=373043 RepID=UPI00361452EE